MTSTTVRTYTMGDVAESADFAGGTYQPGVCNLRIADAAGSTGYGMCSMAEGHDGPQHVAMTNPDRTVVGIAPRETPPEPIVEIPTYEVLRERFEIVEREVQALRRIRDQLRAEVAEHETRMEEFRQEVGHVAMRYARTHDWCSVVRAALSELGIEVTQRWRIRTDVYASCGEWEAKREAVYVTIESTQERGYVYRDVDNMDADDAFNALEAAGVELPDGFEFSRFDASTSDVTALDD